MSILRGFIVFVFATALSGCVSKSIPTYTGPEVTRIVLDKTERELTLLHYDVELGFAPEGHKQFEGDGRTPEGRYYIDRRNPNSVFYLSIGLSYPNAQDRAFARSHSRSPGGDIFIHGTPARVMFRNDWTAGCIAVSNAEMREIYSMVNLRTPIDIYP
jgi:murein L,D-transpeptidase YafK